MMVDFDGAHNVNFRHLAQVIPVEGDTEYTISLYVKSDEISSSEDLRWQVYCLHTPGLDAQTNPISGTHNWRPLTISFKTPEDCTAVNFRLIRNKSNKIGNLISGTVWVDEVKLKRNF